MSDTEFDVCFLSCENIHKIPDINLILLVCFEHSVALLIKKYIRLYIKLQMPIIYLRYGTSFYG